MLRALLSIFRSDDPLRRIGENFGEMMGRGVQLVERSGELFFEDEPEEAHRARIAKKDVKINKLERKIRKRVITHLSLAGKGADLPYCLLLMSLVKDVERIGDLAKDLAGAAAFRKRPLPTDEVTAELRSIRADTDSLVRGASDVFESSDRDVALALIEQGKSLYDRCEALTARLAGIEYPPDLHVSILLAVRYYLRISGHALNIVSSVVVPLHRLDYYSEKDLEKLSANDAA